MEGKKINKVMKITRIEEEFKKKKLNERDMSNIVITM